jgi:hypothetical protein
MPTCLRRAFREFGSRDHLDADQVDWVRGNAIDVFRTIAASPYVPLLSMLNAFLHLVEKKMYDALNRERIGGGHRCRPCDRTVYIDVPSWVFENLAAPTLEAAGFRSSGGRFSDALRDHEPRRAHDSIRSRDVAERTRR